jgi:hypothetical protein
VAATAAATAAAAQQLQWRLLNNQLKATADKTAAAMVAMMTASTVTMAIRIRCDPMVRQPFIVRCDTENMNSNQV